MSAYFSRFPYIEIWDLKVRSFLHDKSDKSWQDNDRFRYFSLNKCRRKFHNKSRYSSKEWMFLKHQRIYFKITRVAINTWSSYNYLIRSTWWIMYMWRYLTNSELYRKWWRARLYRYKLAAFNSITS